MPCGAGKPQLEDDVSIAATEDMRSICGSDMRVEISAPTRGHVTREEEKRPATSPKWNTASGKKSRRNKKKSAEKKATASSGKKNSPAKTKKSRANRRGKRGGKRKTAQA